MTVVVQNFQKYSQVNPVACGNFFCSISSLFLLVTQVKAKASSKKMQLQEVIQKIKTQIKIFIYFSTKIANFSRSDIDMFML